MRFTPSTLRLALEPVTVEVYASAVLGSARLDVTASVPVLPAVPEVSCRLTVPSLLLTIDASNPRVDELL